MKVRGAKNDNRVVLWERDAAHPEGEVFVVNDGKAVEVAETAAVKRLLRDKRLMQDSEPATTPEDSDAKTPEEEVPSLRPATEQEEDAANLSTPTEKETAVVEVSSSDKRFTRNQRK